MDQTDQKNKLRISADYRIISAILLVALIIMLMLWKPWVTHASGRKITVAGSATIKAVPNEYQLSPYFEFSGIDRAKATADLTAFSNKMTAKLTELGVHENQIKSSTSGYDKYQTYPPPADTSSMTLQLTYTITLADKAITQKVQDYLFTLNPKGQISPQATFSEAKSKELQAQAHSQAIDDAKKKAQKTASEIGSKVGRVVTISDDNEAGISPCGPRGLCSGAMSVKDSISSVPVQVGQNDFTSTVKIEYELR